MKRLPVSDLEMQPENRFSTANLFGLPANCHYGVGAPSGGAWRELSAHTVTTQWVLSGASDAFPLLHHWRVLSSDSMPTLDCAEFGDPETWIAFWHGCEAVRGRLEALSAASTELLLFLEWFPRDLLGSLTDQLLKGRVTADSALARVEKQLFAGAAFMAANGLGHFDAHLRNILTDDDQLCFSDFGLAVSSTFDLSPSEQTFLQEHVEHDVAQVATELVNWVVTNLTDTARHWKQPRERNEFVRRCSDGYEPPELPPSAARIVRRYSAIAVVMNDFYFALHGVSRPTPYPAQAIHDACATGGISVKQPLK